MLTLVLVATIAGAALEAGVRSGPPLVPIHFATAMRRFRIVAPPATRGLGPIAAMARLDPAERPPSRPIRNPFGATDALAKYRPVTGINAHIRWYHKVRSIIGIAALVAFMGLLLAASIGVAFFAARIVLELLVG